MAFLPENGNQIHYSSLQSVVGYASILSYTFKPRDEAEIRKEKVQVHVYFIQGTLSKVFFLSILKTFLPKKWQLNSSFFIVGFSRVC